VRGAGLALILLAAPATATAVRPTEGGLWSFDPTDVVEHLDDPTGRVRVHYSVAGPNQTRLADTDTDGFPDFAQDVAERAAEVLAFYEDDLGLRPPVSEADLDLGPLGGSYAFDFYLVDFGGSADGMFSIDGCTSVPLHCAGYMVMENDFVGYGYPSLDVAVEVLTSHELFHAVQSAYEGDLPVWVSEGTAVWGERQFDPTSIDFLWFADAYLEDTGRSLDRPPVGPVPTFAYATALWWDFLTTRHDPDLMDELLLALERTSSEPQDALAAMETVLEVREDTVGDAFATFARWNLATGSRAGVAESYAYAADLSGVTAEGSGASIDDENRFYPLAATYYRLDHPGGPLWFAADEIEPGLLFSLHPVADGAADGPVEDALEVWAAEGDAVAIDGGAALPAGGYWLVGTNAQLAEQSTRTRLCLGSEEDVLACLPEDVEEEGGCACDGISGAPGWVLWLAPLVAIRRRQVPLANEAS